MQPLRENFKAHLMICTRTSAKLISYDFRGVYEVKHCQNLLLQCKDIRPGEGEYIISKARTITTLFKHCHEAAKRKTTTTKKAKAKRSATSEDEPKANDRDGKGSLKI